MPRISNHVFSLARYFHYNLLCMHHQNKAPVIKLYCDTDYSDRNFQGGIVTFNVLRANGEHVGYTEVLNMASLHNIHLRTGCFCNPGACQRHMNLSDEDVLKNYDSGYTCGGMNDLVNGRPSGAIRASFGYMSTKDDVDAILSMLRKCFVTGKEVIKYPSWWSEFKHKIQIKYNASQVSSGFSHENCKIDAIDTKSNDPQNRVQEVFQIQNYVENNNNILHKNGTRYKLARICLFPIKSCGAYEVENSWTLTTKGLQYDREWMIVTASGVCLTQKQDTKLCLIKPVLDFKANKLILNYPSE